MVDEMNRPLSGPKTAHVEWQRVGRGAGQRHGSCCCCCCCWPTSAWGACLHDGGLHGTSPDMHAMRSRSGAPRRCAAGLTAHSFVGQRIHKPSGNVSLPPAPLPPPSLPLGCAVCTQMVLHHYVLKSRREFSDKMARGSGAGNHKAWSYWDYIEAAASQAGC